MYVYMYVCVYICIYVCMYVCMYVHVPFSWPKILRLSCSGIWHRVVWTLDIKTSKSPEEGAQSFLRNADSYPQHYMAAHSKDGSKNGLER